jgi:hypothetical protein
MTIQDKVDYVRTTFPQLSEEGQAYLRSIAQAMRLIDKPAGLPVDTQPEPEGALAGKLRGRG